METANVQARLRRIEGQVQGVQRMLDEGRACDDVLTQLLAVRSAVQQVCLAMAEAHVLDCVLGEALAADDARRQAVADSLKLLVRSGG